MRTSDKEKLVMSKNYENIISVLNIYFLEWSYRDQILWSQIFKFYYAILIIILLPNLTEYFQIQLPAIPDQVFRILGLLLAFLFLYISMGYVIRLDAIGRTYQNLINKLPSEYQRVHVDEIEYRHIPIGKMFKKKLSYIICILLFLTLFFLSIAFAIVV